MEGMGWHCREPPLSFGHFPRRAGESLWWCCPSTPPGIPLRSLRSASPFAVRKGTVWVSHRFGCGCMMQ